jgi:hypothetical protein
MNPFPPMVKVVQARALAKTKRSPRVEVKRKREKENIPFEMMRKTPKKPRRTPEIFLTVIASPRKSRAASVIKMGFIAMIHPVLIAVV